ncbi:MAG: MotA/TolQ/ExbB proton channel family protein, partial [Flavobacteriales bacterium]
MKTFMLLDVTTGGQVAEETGEAIQQVDVSILELILEGSSGIGGGAVMILLALMSIAAIYLFFERTMAIAKAEKVSPDFMNKIRDYIGQGSFDSARNLCQSSNTPMARMLDKGISRIGKDLKD